MSTLPASPESVAYLSAYPGHGLLVPRSALRAPRVPTFHDVEETAPVTSATAPRESGVMAAGWWWG